MKINFDYSDIYSTQSQNAIGEATDELQKLLKSKANEKSPEMNILFGSFVKVLEMSLLTINLKIINRKWCSDSIMMKNFWVNTSHMFVVYIPIILTNILSKKFEVNLNRGNEEVIQRQLNIINMINENSKNFTEQEIKSIEDIRRLIESQKRLGFIPIIEQSLKKSKLPKKDKESFKDFFISINTLRNYYAHYSTGIKIDKEYLKIKKALDFLFKDNNYIEITPHDIFKISKRIFDFLDVIY